VVVKFFAALLALTAIVALGLFLRDVREDQRYSVAIDGPVKLYRSFDEVLEKRGAIRTEVDLVADEKVSVLRIRYGKEIQAIEVMTADGREGWLAGGNSYRLFEPEL
jgi:hypothetical protein